MMHSLLKRLLKKNELSENEAPGLETWQNFLQRVSRAFTDSDQERYLIERSLTISSQEMQEVYEQLQASETRYALAAQGANDGLWDWNLTNDSVYYSLRWCEIMGMTPDPDKIPCKNCWLERIHPEDAETVNAELDAHIEGKTKHFENEHRILHNNGEYRWVLIRGFAVRDENGKAYRIAGSLTDITSRKRTEEKLAFDALHDALTGLPNRKKLLDRLEDCLEKVKHTENYNFAVLFVDLDRFKIINDSMGHQVGDEILLKISRRLTELIRPSDMVARLGGDEFVVLLEGIKDKELAHRIADRILGDLQKPIQIEGKDLYVSASIGIAFSSVEYNNPEDIVRDADLAMYRAKVKGKGRYELFDSKLHSGAVSMLQLEIDLRRAIEQKEFILHYQPIYSLNSERIVGFESLIRWNHPERGMIPPNEFIPVAEETGLILQIGQWVLRESCRQMWEWQEKYPSAKSLVMNVNLSARQLEKKDLVEEVSKILNESGLAPNCLKLEITESVIMGNAEQAIETVRRLRQMGVRLSIDDFGTGYSSLSYLHRFPIDTLKVDRSFVSRIGNEDEHSEIIKTIITLAYNLGMDVVAEGVENDEQLSFLRDINCSYGQGYFYSRPVNGTSAAEMIKEMQLNDFPLIIGGSYELNRIEGSVH